MSAARRTAQVPTTQTVMSWAIMVIDFAMFRLTIAIFRLLQATANFDLIVRWM
jgi:hypothetical protein